MIFFKCRFMKIAKMLPRPYSSCVKPFSPRENRGSCAFRRYTLLSDYDSLPMMIMTFRPGHIRTSRFVRDVPSLEVPGGRRPMSINFHGKLIAGGGILSKKECIHQFPQEIDRRRRHSFNERMRSSKQPLVPHPEGAH